MNPASAILAVLFVTGGALAQQEDTASPQTPVRELLTRSWRVPPGFFPTTEGHSSPNENNPAALNDQADAAGFLTLSGVTFPEGAFARYFPDANTLLIRNTEGNLDLVEMLIGTGGPCGCNPMIAFDIVVLEGTFLETDSPMNSPWLDAESLQKKPVTLRQQSQISTITKSGHATETDQTFVLPAGSEEKASSSESRAGGEFAPNEFGTKIRIEPVLGPDGFNLEATYRIRLRRPSKQHTATEIDLSGSFFTHDGRPVVLHRSPLDEEGKTLIIIVGVRLVDVLGHKVPLP